MGPKQDRNANGAVASSRSLNHLGWAAGIGAEYALDRGWSAKLEYNYIDLGERTHTLDDAVATVVRVDPRLHVLKAGLNYKLTDRVYGNPSALFAPPAASQSDRWNVHGQTTLFVQGYPSFRSPYQGSNSLPGRGMTRETWTNTVFLGWRLWDGGEFFFNPELAQGFGIGSTLGLGGYANGEAQKGGAPYPRIRAQRYFFRQTIGLGGEQEAVPSRGWLEMRVA